MKKTKKTKKLLSALTALTITASAFAGMVVPASAADLVLGAGTKEAPYVSYDFTGDTTGDNKVIGNNEATLSATSADGWITYHVGSSNRVGGAISVKNDTAHGNYAYVRGSQFGDADSNNGREPSIKINKVPDLSELPENNEMYYEFDFSVTDTNGVIYLNNGDADNPSGDFIRITNSKLNTGEWYTAVASIDPATKLCTVEIYNAGGDQVDVQTNTYSASGSPSRLRFLGNKTPEYYYSIDNIKIYKAVPALKYLVVFDVAGNKTQSSIGAGKKITEVPDAAREGYIFDGWYKDNDTETLLSGDDIKALDLTGDTTFTAKYHDDASYVQKIKSVEFISPKSDAILQPEEGATDTYTYNVKVTSDIGKDITADCVIDWKIFGTDKEDGYVNLIPDGGKLDLTVRNGVSNYYGYLQASVKYDPANKTSDEQISTATAETPYAILGNTVTSNFVPDAGYPINMNDYGDSIVGYKARANGLTDKDLVLNHWSIYGSNGSRTLTLKKEEGGDKYLEFAANGGGSSSVGVYQWPAPSQPYIVDATVNLLTNTSFGTFSNTPNNTNITSDWVVTMAGSSIKAGESEVQGVSSGAWYRLVIVADPESKQYYVRVYDEDGNHIGDSDIVTGEGGNKYLCLYGGDTTIGLKSLRAYIPTITKATILGDQTVKVPEAGEAAVTADYSVNLQDADGNKILANAKWSLAEEYANVEINETTGQLKVSEGASGTVTINAAAGSAIAEYDVTLTTSSNVVSLKGASAVTIPFEGEDAAVAEYSAQTLDKDGKPVEGDSITFALLQKDGITPYTTMPKGITFDDKKATLTVEAGANPGIMYVQATNGEGLTNKIRVNVHGMSFSFGTGEPEEGYTQVLATQYTDNLGFGFASTSGLTVAENNVGGSAAYTFQAKVPNGNYKIIVDSTSASKKSETVSGSSITKSGSEFNVAVCDGVMDLTFDANTTITSLQISQVKNNPGAKPAVFSIGDSTTKNSGPITNDNRTYGSWGNCVTDEIKGENFASYRNDGMAGRNSASYYREARLEKVLLDMAPGDYVTINMGINSESGEPYETLMRDYYVEGVIQRGGIPVILTHTPDGVGFGNSQSSYTNGHFDVARASNGRVQFLKNLAKEKGAYLVDVGQHFEDYFNSLELNDETLALANTANSTKEGYVAPASVYDVVHSWYPDHNHYTSELGTMIAKYVFSELDKIVAGETKPEKPDVTTPPVEPTDAPTQPTDAPAQPTDAPAQPTDAPAQPTTPPVEPTPNPADALITFTKAEMEGNTVTISAEVEGEAEAEYTAYVAEYSADGLLLKVVKKDITISDTNNTATVDITPYDTESETTFKAFVWDDKLAPKLTNTTVTKK